MTDPWTPATWPFDWPYDCVTCEDPTDQLVVFFRDCTGACVDAAGVEELRALGFGTLDEGFEDYRPKTRDPHEPAPLHDVLSALEHARVAPRRGLTSDALILPEPPHDRGVEGEGISHF